MIKKVSTDLDFLSREKAVIELWKERDVFRRSIDQREGADVFTFYDGPPTANGKPHFGHILTRAMKDLIPRYQTMKGKNVLRKAGWDTHGLPVELEVEKLLGLDGKEQIEEYGVEPFIAEMQGKRLEIQGRMGEHVRARGLLGGYGRPLHHLRQRLHRVRVVVAQADPRQGPAL